MTFDESKHPRAPAGTPEGGQFVDVVVSNKALNVGGWDDPIRFGEWGLTERPGGPGKTIIRGEPHKIRTALVDDLATRGQPEHIGGYDHTPAERSAARAAAASIEKSLHAIATGARPPLISDRVHRSRSGPSAGQKAVEAYLKKNPRDAKYLRFLKPL